MTRKTQQRRTLLKHNQSTDISGAALNPTAAGIATPAQETTTLRMVPKTQKNPMNKLPNKTIGNQSMSALTNMP